MSTESDRKLDDQNDPGEGNATRREFLKAAAATGAVLAVPGGSDQVVSAQTTFPNGTFAGNVYAIDAANLMRLFQDLARNGLPYWKDRGQISNWWGGFDAVFSGGDGIIHAISAGTLYFYRDTARNGVPSWASGNPIISVGWNVNMNHVFGGPNGALYAIKNDGTLYFCQNPGTGAPGTPSSTATPIGSGWTASNISKVFYGGNGLIFTIDPGGNLHYYRDLGSVWDPRSGTIISSGWGSYTKVFSGGNGIIYAVDGAGDIFFYQFFYKKFAQTGDIDKSWFHGGQACQIGSGWNHKFLMADYGDAGDLYDPPPPPAAPPNPPPPPGPCDPPYPPYDGALHWYRTTVGYSKPLSVSPGGTVEFHVRTPASSLTITYLRLRKGGVGAIGNDDKFNVPMTAQNPSGPVSGRLQPINSLHVSETGCNWDPDFELTIPDSPDWRSGVYAAKCVDGIGAPFYIPFIVKPKLSNRKPIAVLASTNTWNSYNYWGGQAAYLGLPPENLPPRNILSFERPNTFVVPYDTEFQAARTPVQNPAACFRNQNHSLLAELWILRWLEYEGYQFDVYSEQDFHLDPAQFMGYETIIMNTHPEYWTTAMYDSMKQYLLYPNKKLLYLGGNGIYEAVEYAGPNNSRMKLRGGDPDGVRGDFLFSVIGRPEEHVLGVACYTPIYNTFAPYRVENAQHRFFYGTNVQNGDLIGQSGLNGGASGLEVDVAPAGAPNVDVLAVGTNRAAEPTGAGMVCYSGPSQFLGAGTLVFSVGSISFGGALAIDPVLQQIVKNVLDD